MASTLQEAVAAAKLGEAKYGLPAAVQVAQWAVESGWGKFSPGNNCFGIKAYEGCSGKQLLNTTEWFTQAELLAFLNADRERTAVPTGKDNGKRKEYRVKDWFATFPYLADCFDRRCRLALRPIYKPFLDRFKASGDMEAFIQEFGKVYATAPDYADVLLKVIAMPKVQAALNTSGPQPS